MSNPYRVRPTRSRVDPSLSGYGVHSQKPWNPGSVQRPPSVDPNAAFQPPPIANPTKKAEDSWDWNVDNGNNGNDSWNWSIEQSESQSAQQHLQQQPQQQLQQNQYIPPYTNQKQSIPPSNQENYYKNLNGNNRAAGPPVNQYGPTARETPRTAPVREPTPKQPDSFPQYTSYSHNQQVSTPPRPSSNTSYSGSVDQPQWHNEQHSQSLPYASPNQVHNQILPQHQTHPTPPPPQHQIHPTPPPPQHQTHPTPPPPQHQIHPTPPPPQHQTPPPPQQQIHQTPLPTQHQIHQTPPPTQHQIHQTPPPQHHSHQTPPPPQHQVHQNHPPPAAMNNYNWSNTDQQQSVPMHNWQQQNHSEIPASSYWQEPVSAKQDHFSENRSNQWPQSQQASHQSQQRIPHAYSPSNAINNDQPKFYNPHESSQDSKPVQNWLPQNALMSNQWSKSNSENVTNVLPRQQSLPSNTWSQAEEANSLPSWQQGGTGGNIPNSQWRQPKLQPGGSLEESALSENNKGEWHQVHAPPSHFNSSTTSTTSGSLANMSSSTEQLEDRKRSLTPTTSCASLNEFQTQTSIANQVNSENNTASNVESFPSQNNTDLDWGAEAEWNTVTEVTSNINNMSLNPKYNQNVENGPSRKDEQSAAHVVSDWGRQVVPGLKSENIENTLDNVPILTQEHNSTEGQAVVSQEQFEMHQGTSSKSLENVAQAANYDQWYKQNVRTQPENEFFGSDRTHGAAKQWQPEQNVENYENMQQPSEFVNLEVVAPELQERDIYGSRDSINKETLDNDQVLRQTVTPKETPLRDFRQEVNNVEVPVQQIQQPIQAEQAPDNYEFASNDRNTFLETGELTDPHSQEHEPVPPSQDDENDEVPNDIPFLREVPGQSSSVDPRRNDPTGQEQYALGLRMSDPRRNDPSGQEQQQTVLPPRSNLLVDRPTDRRDVPSGQERVTPVQQPPLQQQRNSDLETVERRNDPSGRERSLPPPQQSRNEPSGEEQRIAPIVPQSNQLEPGAVREIPGRGNELEETIQQSDSGMRQIPGGASSNESVQIMPDDRTTGVARVVTGLQQSNISNSLNITQDSSSDNRNKRKEAVGASVTESQLGSGPPNRRDSYEDGDDEGSGNSREGSRDRRRDSSPKSRHPRYDYSRKATYYDRERDYDDDYYYDRRRGPDYERPYNSREDLDRRDTSYRDDDRRLTSRDDLDRDRHPRDDLDRRARMKDEIDDREGRRRMDDRRRDRSADPRRLDREPREFDSRYPRDRDYFDRDRDRRRDDPRRNRRYPDFDQRDPRDTRDQRDSRESYRRDYYDDPYARNSRPSSRSSYNDRENYYMRSRDPYSSYGYNNYQGYDYGSNYNSNYYAYLENLRRTDPAAYAEWYHKYYQQQQQITRGVTATYTEDRASVHSGRSSCDDRNSSDKRNLTDASLMGDQTTVSSRMTPTKFSTAHTKGSFSIGSILHVHASYPADGERARVDILKIDNLMPHDATLRELRCYPGPLIKGVTHKKTIIEYCENKIKKASANDDIFEVSSYVLLYELMIMLIQQNGNVVGVDIASLLLRNKEAYPYDVNKPPKENLRRESTISQRSGASGGDRSIADAVQPLEKDEQIKSRKTVEQLTDEFRNTLLYGLVQEALEFAMVEGLWGHALFLASKLDKRTHASVMTRFANSLPPQDPLQTLYQLHSGRVPASVTCVSDSRWDDWRPHLAMIISNTSANPEINRRSISNLGDTLAARGDIYAAHFCYILSQVDFGPYGSGNNVKLVLIGANHHKPYSEFISTEAIMLTEIYEYARKLSEPFTLVELQTFKFNMAVRMVDYGLIEKALLYIEQVATNIVNEPEKYKQSFINYVYVLGDRLKYHDPICKDSEEDVSNLVWLNNLAEIVGKCAKGEIVQENNYYAPTPLMVDTNTDPPEIPGNQNKWGMQTEYATDNSAPTLMTVPDQDNYNIMPNPANVQDPYGVPAGSELQYTDDAMMENQQQQHYQSYQQDYWTSQQQQQQQHQSYDQQDYNSMEYSQSNMQYGSEQQNIEDIQNKWAYESKRAPEEKTPAAEGKASDAAEHQQQQQQQQHQSMGNISMGPSGGKQYDPLEELEQLEPSKLGSGKPAGDAKKAQEKADSKKQANGGGSWFGGLFSKLAPKPKNQMILPDDSNPAIVWDPVAKKWTNKEDEDGGGAEPLAPPPKMSELPGFKPTVAAPAPMPQNPVAGPPSLGVESPVNTADETLGALNSSKMLTGGGGNMYKLSRSRNMRANYVDVMNPGGKKPGGPAASVPAAAPLAVPTPVGSPAMPIATSSPQYFIPAPVNDPNAPVNFLTPLSNAAPQMNENSQALSRWSSTSSLSREVQSYTMRDPRLLQRDKGPMMYNPVDLKDRSQKSIQARSRYPPR